MSALFVTGDETGLLKAIDYRQQTTHSFGDKQNRELSIIGLVKTFDEKAIALLRTKKLIEFWKHDLENRNIDFQKIHSIELGISNLIDLVPVYDSSLIASHLLVYSQDGEVNLLRNNYELLEEDLDSHLQSFSVKGPLSAAASGNHGGMIFGGRENDIQYYDIHTQKCLWEARNVPHDKLRLRVPVWITALDFFHPLSSHSFDQATFLSGTAYKHVRIYDTKANNRPVQSINIEGDFRVTVVKSSLDGNGFYVADTAGNVYFYDYRTYRRLNTLRCFQGSVRSLAIGSSSGSTGTVVAGVGLDRTIRVYNANQNNKFITRIYLKNRLNRCLAFDNFSSKGEKKERKAKPVHSDDSNEDSDDDDDEGEDDGDEDRLEDIEFDSDEDFGIDRDANSDDEVESGEESEDDDESEESEHDNRRRKSTPNKRQRYH